MKFLIENNMTMTKVSFIGMGLCVIGLVVIQLIK